MPLIPSNEPESGSDLVFREGYEVTTELVEALIVALEREMRLHKEGGLPDTYLEMGFGLVNAIAATRHPLTVDILLRSWWGDSMCFFCSARMWCFPAPLNWPGSPQATPEEAWGALHVLEGAVERLG